MAYRHWILKGDYHHLYPAQRYCWESKMIMVQSTPENEHKYFQKSGCYFFVLPISLMLLLLMASVFNWFGWLILSPFILVLIFLVYGSRHAILYRNTPALTLNEEGWLCVKGGTTVWLKSGGKILKALHKSISQAITMGVIMIWEFNMPCLPQPWMPIPYKWCG